MKINKLSMFQLGLVAFAAVTGFLASTNNGALLQPTLFAIGGAIVVVLGIVQKFYIDRTTTTRAAAMVPEVVSQLGNIPLQNMDLPLVTRHIAREMHPAGTYQFLGEQARTLGAVLLSLSFGFIAGFIAGVIVRRTWPLLLTDRFAIAIPWTTSPPSDPLQAAGWMAVSERVAQAGAPVDEVRAMYRSAASAPCADEAQRKGCDASKAAIADLGRKWLERGVSTSSSSAAASTKDPAPALSPIIDSTKAK